MSKTLSTGTLNLRFMQNAQRAKQEAQAELEQAKIKDEAEWEVSQEVKDAWGLGPTPAESISSPTASHEASYIPFLFTASSSTSVDNQTIKPKGRRTFNSEGQEAKPELQSEVEKAEGSVLNELPPAKRLASISGFKAPLSIKHTDQRKGTSKTVQELIREDPQRQPSRQTQPATRRGPTGFVKPAGVDGPSINPSKAEKSAASSSLKRERDGQSGHDSSAEVKRRRKKEVQLIE